MGSILSYGERWLSLVGVLVNIPRGATVLLVWYIDTKICLCFGVFFGLCAIMLDCWLSWYISFNGKRHNTFIGSRYHSIIFLLCFLKTNLFCQMWKFVHCYTVAQLKWGWSGEWGIFLHVFPVLINFEVGAVRVECMILWINWVV